MTLPLDISPYFSGAGLTFTANGLPAGLSIDPATGVISGAPTVVQTTTVTVIATNPAGQASDSFVWTITGTGSGSGSSGSGPDLPPAIVTAPAISGIAEPGQVLTASPGIWEGEPAPVLSLQWLRNGAPVAGATATAYTLAGADAGMAVSVRVTATNSADSAIATSAAVSVLDPGAGVPTTLTLVEPLVDRMAYPEQADGFAHIPVSVTGVDVEGAVIQVRERLSDGGETWTDLPAVSGGATAGTFRAVAQNGVYFPVEVRARDAVSVAAASTARIGVGPVILLPNQSQIEHCFTIAYTGAPILAGQSNGLVIEQSDNGTASPAATPVIAGQVYTSGQTGNISGAVAAAANYIAAELGPRAAFVLVECAVSGTGPGSLADDESTERHFADGIAAARLVHDAGSHVSAVQHSWFATTAPSGSNAGTKFAPAFFGLEADGSQPAIGTLNGFDASYDIDHCIVDLRSDRAAGTLGIGLADPEKTVFYMTPHLRQAGGNMIALGQRDVDAEPLELWQDRDDAYAAMLEWTAPGGVAAGIAGAHDGNIGTLFFETGEQNGTGTSLDDSGHVANDRPNGTPQYLMQTVAGALASLGLTAKAGPVITAWETAPDASYVEAVFDRAVTTPNRVDGGAGDAFEGMWDCDIADGNGYRFANLGGATIQPDATRVRLVPGAGLGGTFPPGSRFRFCQLQAWDGANWPDDMTDGSVFGRKLVGAGDAVTTITPRFYGLGARFDPVAHSYTAAIAQPGVQLAADTSFEVNGVGDAGKTGLQQMFLDFEGSWASGDGPFHIADVQGAALQLAINGGGSAFINIPGLFSGNIVSDTAMVEGTLYKLRVSASWTGSGDHCRIFLDSGAGFVQVADAAITGAPAIADGSDWFLFGEQGGSDTLNGRVVRAAIWYGASDASGALPGGTPDVLMSGQNLAGWNTPANDGSALIGVKTHRGGPVTL